MHIDIIFLLHEFFGQIYIIPCLLFLFISNFEFNICVDKKHRAHYTWSKNQGDFSSFSGFKGEESGKSRIFQYRLTAIVYFFFMLYHVTLAFLFTLFVFVCA